MAFTQKRDVESLGLVLLSFVITVSSQCDRVKSCPNGGLCVNECERGTEDKSALKILVVIMSVSVVLIVGLVLLLVYICFKKGPWTSYEESRHLNNQNQTVTGCQSTAVEILPQRRRFSSMSMTTGPPPYFSLFDVILQGESTAIRSITIEQNRTRCANVSQLQSVDVELPEYNVLFGQSPPQYQEAVQMNQQCNKSVVI